MPFVYREINGIGYYEVSGWKNAAGIFTTRIGGKSEGSYESLNLSASSGDDTSVVESNRRRLNSALGIKPGMIKTIRQVHGSDVYELSNPDASRPRAGFDAIVTRIPGVAVSVLTADCVPILLYDPVKGVVAAVHAGWSGTVSGIVGRAVRTMEQSFGTSTGDLLAAIGPSIGPCCYEVDEKVVTPLKQNILGGGGLIFPTRAGHWQLDLWEANTRLMVSAGVKRTNILVMGLCTSCNADKFYSHRKSGGSTGRMMALAWIKDGNTHSD